jgi:hypothetical protein
MAGLTKVSKEIVLDKHVKLIDSPGVVFASSLVGLTYRHVYVWSGDHIAASLFGLVTHITMYFGRRGFRLRTGGVVALH